ncbi:N-acetylmuramoyl-L-alanine amidase [Streptomyces sp. B1866]|uniref:N-acetylmuramoyl-L-alanine amidase n=1 Tax=Streptomyces sp. B1866 TaxID=3075431 RepID=UPI00288E717E|nr:N-acetylmuramoyl-L-alanine amidase [Streptomyces sp. B1866]MDT3399374.1 N-acetylmuramoyl-L-alanine amidase [Streptomyces sp. B1866]
MDAHGLTPSRRTVLRRGGYLGAAALGIAATAATAAPARAGGAGGSGAAVAATTTDYAGAVWTPASSSNYTASSRPGSYPIDYVVIHVTQETYPDTIAIFQDPSAKVSAHYVVRSADGFVGQCVREKNIAWHAGNWDYNTRSIGIEHEGWVDQPQYFTDALYRASAALTAAICRTYNVPRTRTHIIGHYEVPGATHTDPGPNWDWNRYMSLVNAS